MGQSTPASEFAFDNPPVDEVVIAAYFDPPMIDLRSQHIGLFWECIRDQFPNVHQRPSFGFGGVTGLEEPFPMPGYVFATEDDVYVVQIEKGAFQFNWRRRDNNTYPGFHEDIYPAFDRLYDEFETFLRREVGVSEVSLDLCELSYVDIIEQCDYWQSPLDTSNVIPSFMIPLPNTEGIIVSDFDYSYVYSVDKDLEIFVRMQTLVNPMEPDRPVLALEMKASNEFGGVRKVETEEWFQHAHDTLLDHFIRLTDEQVQRKHWGMRTEDSM